MALTRINQNIAAMNAQRNLALNTWRIGVSMERLSSGLRINRAADDPSGLVMSELLRVQVSGLDVVQQNVAEAVNLIKTAEAALTEMNALLRQINDLALDAASNTNNSQEARNALQAQVASALSTIDAIASNTKYAGNNLLDGSVGVKATILDTTHIASAQFASSVTSGQTTVTVTAAATKASADTTNTYSAVTSNLDNGGTIVINGVIIGTYTTTNTVQDVINDINSKSHVTGVTATWDSDHVELNQVNYGSDQRIIYTESADILNGAAGISQAGTDAVATVTGAGAGTYNAGKGLVLQDATTGNKITLTQAGNQEETWSNAISVASGRASFQVGLTASETAEISIRSVTTTSLGIANLDISTVAGATAALSSIADAIEIVNTLRGELGAFQSNKLESQGRSLAVARENLAASESSIRDTDFGKEMAEFSTAQILVQSATAFLAQANALPQNVLQLIRGA